MKRYILSLDCGTTGNRALIFDQNQSIVATSYREFTQIYPKSGWVEHDASEIWSSVQTVLKEVLRKVPASQIHALGITNQRETIVIWDRNSGKPVHNAIVWQCRRTTAICDHLKKQGHEKEIHHKTGLFLDPYFSATKIQWLMQHYPAIKKGLQTGRLLCGTIDTWIIWNLSGRQAFTTDPTNASRTLLYNIRTHKWDRDLAALFKVPLRALPKILPSASIHGHTDPRICEARIPIAGVAGDQQAAAFAQGCSPQGVIKNTYGTGLFVVVDIGNKLKISPRLITTMAASDKPSPCYALEGSVFIGGAAIQWLRDGLKMIKKASESETIVRTLKSNDGVYFVPALSGLGCPYWNPHARGIISGLTRQTTSAHLVRAALESLAYQTNDVIEVVKKETRLKIKRLQVDGGAVQNNWLLQFQADILRCEVERPRIIETTALGAAALAGITTGIWKNQKHFLSHRKTDRLFKPKMSLKEREHLLQGWTQAIRQVLVAIS